MYQHYLPEKKFLIRQGFPSKTAEISTCNAKNGKKYGKRNKTYKKYVSNTIHTDMSTATMLIKIRFAKSSEVDARYI